MIFHVHSPERVLELPSDPNQLRKPPFWFTEQLGACGAKAVILEPGFEGDITPSCFVPKPGMPGGRFLVKVEESGERATVASRGETPEGGSRPGVAGTARGGEFDFSGGGMRIPEESIAVALIRGGRSTSTGKPHFECGGQVLALSDIRDVANLTQIVPLYIG